MKKIVQYLMVALLLLCSSLPVIGAEVLGEGLLYGGGQQSGDPEYSCWKLKVTTVGGGKVYVDGAKGDGITEGGEIEVKGVMCGSSSEYIQVKPDNGKVFAGVNYTDERGERRIIYPSTMIRSSFIVTSTGKSYPDSLSAVKALPTLNWKKYEAVFSTAAVGYGKGIGDVEISKIQNKVGETVTITATPERTENFKYKFLSWSTDPEGKNVVSRKAKYTFKVTKPVTYYANFESDTSSSSSGGATSKSGSTASKSGSTASKGTSKQAGSAKQPASAQKPAEPIVPEELKATLAQAQKGDAKAQLKIGEYFWKENGKRSQGVEWFRKSAEQGNAQACYYLGESYRLGIGTTKNASTGVEWLKKGADKGNVMSMYQLAECYEKGEGVAKNKQQALYWYEKVDEKAKWMGVSNDIARVNKMK